jgi:hypothetical protein
VGHQIRLGESRRRIFPASKVCTAVLRRIAADGGV